MKQFEKLERHTSFSVDIPTGIMAVDLNISGPAIFKLTANSK